MPGQNEFETADLALAMERNYITGFKFLSGINKAVFFDNSSMTGFWSGYDASWMNAVFRIDGSSARLDQLIDEALARFSDVPLGWRVGPLTEQPARVEQKLLEVGLTHCESSPGLVLKSGDCLVPAAEPSDFEVRMVSSPQEVKDWLCPYSRGFEIAVDIVKHFEIYMLSRLNQAPFEAWFVGYLKGEPVTSASYLADSAITMIYNVATVPKSRRLGCARWTVEKAIEHAWQKFGLPIGLYASQSGLSVYQKMGFEHLNRVEVYRRL